MLKFRSSCEPIRNVAIKKKCWIGGDFGLTRFTLLRPIVLYGFISLVLLLWFLLRSCSFALAPAEAVSPTSTVKFLATRLAWHSYLLQTSKEELYFCHWHFTRCKRHFFLNGHNLMLESKLPVRMNTTKLGLRYQWLAVRPEKAARVP